MTFDQRPLYCGPQGLVDGQQAYDIHVQGDGSGRNWWATVTAEVALAWGRRASQSVRMWVYVEPVRPGYRGPAIGMQPDQSDLIEARLAAAAEAIEWRSPVSLGGDPDRSCPSDPAHGACVPRPLEKLTPEQRWCGTWYDCRCCSSSILDMSAGLRSHVAAERARQDREDDT